MSAPNGGDLRRSGMMDPASRKGEIDDGQKSVVQNWIRGPVGRKSQCVIEPFFIQLVVIMTSGNRFVF